MGKTPSILSSETFRWIGLIIGPLIYLGLYCFMGQLVTNQSYMIAYAAYMSNWYQYPSHFKKFIILIIEYSQRDYRLTAMGFVKCDLDNFKKVHPSIHSSIFCS